MGKELITQYFNFRSNKNWPILFIIIYFINCFSYFTLINLHTPLMADDIAVFNLTSAKLNLWDLLVRDITYTYKVYFIWGGRVFGNLIEYSGIVGTVYFDIGNAIVFCFFIYAVFLCANLRKPTRYSDLITLILMTATIWFFFNELAEVSFWKIGSSYLWIITGTLYIIYPFLHLYQGKDIISGSTFKTILLILSALFLGTGLEHLSVATSILFILISGYYYRRNKKIPIWAVLTTFAYLVGSIILFASPGSYIRFANESQQINSHLSITFLMGKIYPMAVAILHHYAIDSHFQFLLFFIATLVIFLLPLKHNFKTIRLALLMLFMVILTAFSLIGAPGIRFAARGAFYSDTFFIIAMFSIIVQANQFTHWRRIINGIGALALLCLTYSMMKNYQDILTFHRQVQERERLISFYQQKNVSMAYIPALYFDRFLASTYPTHEFDNFHIHFGDILPNQPSHWVNQEFAQYYHLDQVQLRPFVEFLTNFADAHLLTQTATGFSVYMKDNKLFFASSQHSCSSLAYKTNFFVRIYPNSRTNLPYRYMLYGFYDVDFRNYKNHLVTLLTSKGEIANGLCVLALNLPHYPFNRIEMGQYESSINKQRVVLWQDR